ncbi:MAG: hypothetical protein E7406_00165 [Ruminococcaceae bacterium]|nr:hypothetical protein [Oscillospiraceae bacterium]
MKVFIDADGCPVVNETVSLCREFSKECIIICDTSHRIEKDGAQTIIVEKGADSADFKLVNLLSKGDIAVTQDYALAAMGLSRGARIINQNGLEYSDSNIDSLLMSRFIAKKVRNAGGRLKGPAKRTKEQTESFVKTLRKILEEAE